MSIVAVCTLSPAKLRAQSDDLILHEYVEPGELESSSSSETGAIGEGDGPARGGAPPSRQSNSATRAPDLTLDRGSGEVIRGPGGPVEGTAQPYGPASPGGGATLLDDKTDTVDPLNYHATFDPSVYPYKRNVSQDRIAVSDSGGYQMTAGRGNVRRVPVGGEARDTEDTFWGTFLIRAEAGSLHPVPSVAPGQRVLEVHAEPDVGVQPARDQAGNWYLRIGSDGLVRVTMRVAAPHFYFEGEFDDGVSWSDFDRTTTRLPDRARPVARDVAELVGISREQSPGEVVRELVRYFRNFETRALTEAESAGDLYRTIATRQVGVCRHRSLAFVITAASLGIPARYVSNEAHAFIEVWWPRGGWRRVDLGGAARDIAYRGNRSSTLHRRGGFENLPTPPRFDAALEQARGGAEGEAGEGASEAGSGSADSSDGEPAQGEAAQSEASEAMNAQTGDAGTRSRAQMQQQHQVERGAAQQRQQSEGRQGESLPEEFSSGGDGSDASGPSVPTRLTMTADRQTVMRGSNVELSGRLRTQTGAPLPDRTVRILIGSPGSRTAESMRELATVTTDSRGRWSTTVAIPESTSIGRWSLVARFSGDESNAPSIAR